MRPRRFPVLFASSLLLVFSVTLLASPSEAVIGVDVADLISESEFVCLKNHGYHFAIVRAYHSYGGVDVNAPATVANAWRAGIAHVDVYHFPCQGKLSAAAQMNDLSQFLKAHNVTYGMVWLDIEENPSPGCGWSTSTSSNCQFLSELISAGQSHGFHMGVYASNYEWGATHLNGCTAGSHLPLWYAHYDNSQTFSDFSSFGGWSKPAIKQFNDRVGVCGVDADSDWYPN